jgi:hypothetical protein
MRSGLAAAPNYAEARAAESRPDFIHMWLEQVVANGLFSRDKMVSIIAENKELCFIIAASIKTASGRRGPI